MYTVTIKFPQGPTISDDDSTLVTVVKWVHTKEEANDLQQAALTLGADSVNIQKPKKGSTS